MDEKRTTDPEYVSEIIKLLNNDKLTKEELADIICNYHAADISDALENLDSDKRKKIFDAVSDEQLSEIFAYLEDVDQYIKELNIKQAANILSEMDSDDAVDVLEEIDDETEDKIIHLMDEESSEDVKLIQSYEEDEVGSKMTTNYIEIKKNMSIKEAMKSLVAQAEDNDNVSTIYVSDENEQFYGAIDLKDLIVARNTQSLESIITNSYPTVYDHELISDVLEDLKDYSEDSYPVLNQDKHIIGIITANDIVEVVDDEMGDDYAKLGGLSSEEDLNESTISSIKKRFPWLFLLLVLGMFVSSVVGIFEQVVDYIAVSVCFQSLILDMAGNVGTQSLAVTIRVLMDENLTGKEKRHLIFKEAKVGFGNGLILSTATILIVTCYVHFLKGYDIKFSFVIACCAAIALVCAMVISSIVGTTVPMIFHSLNIDPAVASGPLITTINDLVAVVCYYGMIWLLMIEVLHLV